MDKRTIARILGKSGGEKTKEKYGTEHYKRISKLAAEARKKKKSEAKLALDNTPTAC